MHILGAIASSSGPASENVSLPASDGRGPGQAARQERRPGSQYGVQPQGVTVRDAAKEWGVSKSTAAGAWLAAWSRGTNPADIVLTFAPVLQRRRGSRELAVGRRPCCPSEGHGLRSSSVQELLTARLGRFGWWSFTSAGASHMAAVGRSDFHRHGQLRRTPRSRTRRRSPILAAASGSRPTVRSGTSW